MPQCHERPFLLLYIHIHIYSKIYWIVSDAKVVSSIPLKEIKYSIFSFSRSGNEAKRSVKLCHSTRNAFRIRRKMGNEIVFIWTECFTTRSPDSLCLSYDVRDTAWKQKKDIMIPILHAWHDVLVDSIYSNQNKSLTLKSFLNRLPPSEDRTCKPNFYSKTFTLRLYNLTSLNFKSLVKCPSCVCFGCVKLIFPCCVIYGFLY